MDTLASGFSIFLEPSVFQILGEIRLWLVGFKNVVDLSESYAILVSLDQFPSLCDRISDDSSFVSKVGSVLVESRTDLQNKLKGFSPDRKFPQAEFAPYHNFSYCGIHLVLVLCIYVEILQFSCFSTHRKWCKDPSRGISRYIGN